MSTYSSYEIPRENLPPTSRQQEACGKCCRGVLIAGACILGLLALAAAALALSILFPPLAIPVMTGALIALGLPSLVKVGILAGISLVALSGTIFCSKRAHAYTKGLRGLKTVNDRYDYDTVRIRNAELD